MSEPGSVRAGVVVTGTEVLGGRVADRNGPWLSQRLQELGVELAHVTIVGDRPQDMRRALDFMAAEGLDLVITSGGLGPTADDLTATVVGEFQGRPMTLDAPLEERIAQILARMAPGRAAADADAARAANRKQALIPRGATILEPVGTAPGLVVAPTQGQTPLVVVLPGPPRELQPMWGDAVATPALAALLARAGAYTGATLRLFGVPESMLAQTLRAGQEAGVGLQALEVTTCARRGELEVYARFPPQRRDSFEALVGLLRDHHGDAVFSLDGSTVDEQVAALLLGEEGGTARARDAAGADDRDAGARRPRTIATAESCTGGLLAARLTDLPGSSRYVRGAIVAYANDVKERLAVVAGELIERHGAVSREVAEALADGAREQLQADVGVGVTGVAGPDGGTPDKPVGLVWLSVVDAGGARATRAANLPGGRADVRDRATTVAMHMLRRLLSGQPPLPDAARGAAALAAPAAAPAGGDPGTAASRR